MMLVTGASGFVGRVLCEELLKRNFPVIPVTRFSTVAVSRVIRKIDGNTEWSDALKQCETVVHLAARVHVMNDKSNDPLSSYRETNVIGTLHLANQAAIAGVRRFIFLSSVKVNGEFTVAGQLFREDDKPAPMDPYGISKMEAEQGLRQIAVETGMEVVIIRPPLVYGPGVKANFAALIRAVQRGWILPLGTVNNQRSLIALVNLVDFIIHCAMHPLAANKTFLVSDGIDVSTTALIRSMARAANRPARLLSVPVPILQMIGRFIGRTNAVERLCCNLQVDISKAKNILNWRPLITLDEGLTQCIAEQND